MTTPPQQPFSLSDLMPTPDAKPVPAKRRRTGLIVGLVAAAVLLVGGGVAAALVVAGGPSEAEIAQKACTEEYVPAKLKAPATAKFPSVATVNNGTPGYFGVTGQVDAQNSFGALVRGSFSCSVHVVDGRAELVSINVFGH